MVPPSILIPHTPRGEGPRSERVSADGVPYGFTLSETAMLRKGAPPFLRVASLRGKGAEWKRAFLQEGRKSSLPSCAAAGERSRDEVLNVALSAAKDGI